MKYLLGITLFALVLPPAFADDQKPTPKKTAVTYEVPYRLAKTKHVMVRVKLNGKGPFNFLIDTGASSPHHDGGGRQEGRRRDQGRLDQV